MSKPRSALVKELQKLACTRCGAKPGQVCKGIQYGGGVGNTSVRPHAERIREYERRQEAK